MMWAAFDSVVFLLGFVVCWQTKDTVKAWALGPERTAVDFRAGLNEILVAARKGRTP